MTLTEKHWVAWLFYAAKEWRGWFHVRAEELISIGFKWSWMQRISSPLVSSAEWRKPNDKCKCCFSHVLMSRLHLTHLTFGIGSSTLYVVSDAVYRPYVGSWLCDSHGRVFVPLLSLSTKRLPNHFVGPGWSFTCFSGYLRGLWLLPKTHMKHVRVELRSWSRPREQNTQARPTKWLGNLFVEGERGGANSEHWGSNTWVTTWDGNVLDNIWVLRIMKDIGHFNSSSKHVQTEQYNYLVCWSDPRWKIHPARTPNLAWFVSFAIKIVDV
jgi:hypothetical protein